MSKIYFYYGVMSAGKTSLAINKAYEFRGKGQKVYVCLPSTAKKEKLESKNGSSANVDIIFDEPNLCNWNFAENSILVIDEAQFFTNEQVKTLKQLAKNLSLNVFCFGLLTDFRLNIFEGSKALLVYADSVRELPSMCDMCGKKAKYNLRTSNDENQINLDKNIYKSLCYDCFNKLKAEDNKVGKK